MFTINTKLGKNIEFLFSQSSRGDINIKSSKTDLLHPITEVTNMSA